jgi:ABC-type antimicrobial peptide transport system permease subunit
MEQSSSAKYGLLIGLIGVGILMIQYLTNSLMQQGVFQYISPIIYLALLYFFAAQLSKESNAFWSYWQAWKVLAIESAVACVVYVGFSYLLFNAIDPEMGESVNKFIKTTAIEQMQKLSSMLGEEGTEKAIADIEANNYVGLKTHAINFFSSVAMSLIAGFILAIFLRKKDPNAYLNG